MAGLDTLGGAISAWNSATGNSVDPSQPWNTPGWDTPSQVGSLHALFNAWAQGQNGGQIPDYGDHPNAGSVLLNAAGASAPPTAATANAAMAPPTISPATISSQFPGGIPQATASGVGGIPAITPQQITGSQIDPAMSVAATQAYLLPQFDEQQRALTANLANAGIVGGTAPKAAAELGQQQQTTLQHDIQPFLQAGALANQGNTLDVQKSNQSADLNAQTTNAGNTMQGSEFNATAQNQAQQFNIQNLLQTGQIDAATYNAMMSQVMGIQNQDWLAQLQTASNVTTNNTSNNVGAFQPVYQQPPTSNASGLGAAAGSAFRVPQPSAQIGGAPDPAFGTAGKAA